MGLDMYLTGKKYVNCKVGDRFPEFGPNFEKLPLSYIEVELAYWRKANQIHNWFVKNIQGGVDECQYAHCSKDDLKQLVSVCKKILEAKGNKRIRLAETLLPPHQGFFFGSLEIDDRYFNVLECTVEDLEKVINNDLEDWDIFYQSSW